MKRIVFMGTPEFAIPTLEVLLSSENKVIAIYTQPDKVAGRGQRETFSPVKTMALAHGLPVLQPVSLKQPEAVEELANLRPDLIVVAAFGQILPPSVLSLPPFGCLNIHPSFLPRHRGPSPIAFSILAGDELTGVSIMLLDVGLDTGPLLAQREITISPEDTTGSLTEKLARLGAQLLGEILPAWLGQKLVSQAQDEAKATYSRVLNKEGGEINWQLPAVELWRKVRAFQPWPGCYTRWRGKLLRVISALPLPGKEAELGRVIATPASLGAVVGIQTGDGILGLCQVQLEGKKVMGAADFLRGQRDFIGALLPS